MGGDRSTNGRRDRFDHIFLSHASHRPARPPCPCLCPPRNRFVANQAHTGALRVDDQSGARAKTAVLQVKEKKQKKPSSLFYQRLVSHAVQQ